MKLKLSKNGKTTYLRVYSATEAQRRTAQLTAQGYAVKVLRINQSR